MLPEFVQQLPKQRHYNVHRPAHSLYSNGHGVSTSDVRRSLPVPQHVLWLYLSQVMRLINIYEFCKNLKHVVTGVIVYNIAYVAIYLGFGFNRLIIMSCRLQQ